MSDRHHRDQELQHRISRTVLTSPEAWRRLEDAASHLQIEILRDLLPLTDKAMEAEGVDRETRDRVVHWILIGEPAPRWDQDPNAELDQAIQSQLATQKAYLRYMNGEPPNTEGLT